MRLRSGIGSKAAALVVLAAFAAGCGGGGSDATAEKPPTADKSAAGTNGAGTGTGTGTEKPKGGTGGFGALFNTEKSIQAALPDPGSMRGWTPKTGRAHIVDQPKSAADCGPDPDWECAAIANGLASFEEFGETAAFTITAFTDQKAAEAACLKEKDSSAKYTKADVSPVPGVGSSHAYYRNAGGLDGLNLTMCLGTVIAEVRLEGGGSDLSPTTSHNLAQIFVSRIQKAAAAS
ncbi:hypothetical protein [Streptomyces sp. NRRL F-2580]|uniref:hypothetical protein n=1 Tax=Streptomyces sp. NRRL F-2580 TaxID=1463841 RepID=UPI00131B580C|nr:hypothetical protein [Streptomyces sp. NRRL F-2580]